MDSPAKQQPQDSRPDAASKKPYVKPAFVRERAFETMALACGKININQAQCKNNRKNS